MSLRRSAELPTVSPKELMILELLVNEGRMYGLELVAASRGHLKRGTVYVTLGRMEEKGYVRSRQEDAPAAAGGLPRRVYEPTALGRRVCDAWGLVRQQLAPGLAR
jgi:DNA-binding PadR family transcriptional regulator